MTETVKISVGGKPYELPPMKFKQIKLAWKALGDLQLLETETPAVDSPAFLMHHAERIDIMLRVISAAAIRDYPELTPEYLDENLLHDEVNSAITWFNSILGTSGFKLGEKEPSDQINGTEVIPPGLVDSTATSTVSLPN